MTETLPPRSRPLILIIDDDEGIRDAMVEFLEDEGFTTVAAANALEAVELVADLEQPIALILLDLMMPVMDGWAFCQLRQGVQKLLEVPVVAMSAEHVIRSRGPLRVDATLQKPIDPDELGFLAKRIADRRAA